MNKNPLSKTDIVEHAAEQAGISKVAAGRALNAILEAISTALANGRTVPLLGFGTFSAKKRAARLGRNPKTGAPINIDAANVPVFKAGKVLKDAVNSGTIVLEEESVS